MANKKKKGARAQPANGAANKAQPQPQAKPQPQAQKQAQAQKPPQQAAAGPSAAGPGGAPKQQKQPSPSSTPNGAPKQQAQSTKQSKDASRLSAAPKPFEPAYNAARAGRPWPMPKPPTPSAPTTTQSDPSRAKASTDLPEVTLDSLKKAVELAVGFLERGFVAHAFSQLSAALDPARAEAPEPEEANKLEKVSIFVGEAFDLAGKHESRQALARLDEAEKLWPKAPATGSLAFEKVMAPARRLRFAANVHLHDHEGMVKASDPMVETIDFDIEDLYQRVHACWETNRFDEAARAATLLLRNLGEGELDERRKYASQIVHVAKDRQTGSAAFKDKRWDRAITFYMRAVKVAEEIAELQAHSKSLGSLYFNVGMAQSKAGQHRAAVDYFDLALECDCDHVKALRNRAVAYEQLGELQEALWGMENALAVASGRETEAFCDVLRRDMKRLEDLIDEEDFGPGFNAYDRFFFEFAYTRAEQLHGFGGGGRMQDQHFHTLGLEPGATEVEIKTAFKSLARQHHPDKGGDEEKFKEIRHAYGVLIGEDISSELPPECNVM
ncbi:Type I HSP40 co-chaperone [Rhodotorula sphaerocarpa]